MQVKKGEIYYAILKGEGSVQNGCRPVIISSNNQNNTYAPTVQVIPLTSRDKKRLPVHVDIPKSCGVDKDSIALVEQEQTIDKRNLGDKIGDCSNNILAQIDKAIMIQKGMEEVVDMQLLNHLARSVVLYGNLIKKLNLNPHDVIYYGSTLQELKAYCEKFKINYKNILQSIINNEGDEIKCSLRKIVGVI